MEADASLNARLVQVGGRQYRDLSAGAPIAAIQPRQAARAQEPQQPRAQQREPDLSAGASGSASMQGPAGTGGSNSMLPGRHSTAQEATTPAQTIVDEDDVSITQEGSGGFVSKFSCDARVFPFLIGAGGVKKKGLERQTGTVMDFPRRDANGMQADDVTIRGPTRLAVASAKAALRREMQAVLFSDKRGGLDFTHFVSLPLTSPGLQQQYAQYTAALMADPELATYRVVPQMLVPPEQLHLTLQMLKLYSAEARQTACTVLAGLAEPIKALLSGSPLEIRVSGLGTFSNDTSSANVLYLQVQDVQPGDRMARLCRLVVDAFRSAGLVSPTDNRPVQLHATVLNTSHVPRDGNGQRPTIDVTQLLKGSADLGVHVLTDMHVSQRHKWDEQTKYYWALGQLQLAH